MPSAKESNDSETAKRLRLFDEATERQRQRERDGVVPTAPVSDGGWTRDELYDRTSPR